MLHKFNNRFFKDDHTLSKECHMHTVYHMFRQCLIVLGFKDAHSSNYNIFQEESCLHQRMLFPKYGSLSWKISHYAFRKNDVQLWRTYFTCLHVPCVLDLRIYISWKGHCMCKRVHFWHRSRLRHDLLQWDALLEEMHLLKGALTLKRCITPFQGNHLKCLSMCWLKGLTQQCQYQNQFYKFIGCLCFCNVF